MSEYSAEKDAGRCHLNCALGENADHPGYLGYRCVNAVGEALPWPSEIAEKYDGWEPWEDATWD